LSYASGIDATSDADTQTHVEPNTQESPPINKSLLFALALVLASSGAAYAGDGLYGWEMAPLSLPDGFAKGTLEYMRQQKVDQYFQRQSGRVAAAPAAQRPQPVDRRPTHPIIRRRAKTRSAL
jgi:hypothetical protein